MRTSLVPYSCWECGDSMKMEIEANADNVKMRVAGRRECVEDWKNFIVFAFEHSKILKEPCSLYGESENSIAEIIVSYLEFILYIRED